MTNKLKSLVEISHKIGSRPEYVQGGGGNVSVKLGPAEMAIKASGFRLSDMSLEKGFVTVDHTKIEHFYNLISGQENIVELTASHGKLLSDSVSKSSSNQALRPSMETGFHSFGGDYVLHTHSVYANILNCSKEGRGLLAGLFKDALYVPYSTPGLPLTLVIQNLTKGDHPPIIFLENHGIIINSATPENVYDIHESVNNLIKKKLGIKDPYPTLQDRMQNVPDKIQEFKETILFPDQAVYGEFVATSYNETLAFQETFAAWLFIMEQIKRLGFTPKTISQEEGNLLVNLDSEKYRKSILS